MSTVEVEAEPKAMSVEEFLALPDDGVRRELIRGEVREELMTYRNRFHSHTESHVAFQLVSWWKRLPGPRGMVVTGEAGFRLRGTKDSLVGVDVAYASDALVAATSPNQAIFDGPPVLAVEILSPSDRYQNVIEKVGLYLEAGVVVWVVDPAFRTVIVHRPGRPVEALGPEATLSGEPELPGFSARVADLFE